MHYYSMTTVTVELTPRGHDMYNMFYVENYGFSVYTTGIMTMAASKLKTIFNKDESCYSIVEPLEV